MKYVVRKGATPLPPEERLKKFRENLILFQSQLAEVDKTALGYGPKQASLRKSIESCKRGISRMEWLLRQNGVSA